MNGKSSVLEKTEHFLYIANSDITHTISVAAVVDMPRLYLAAALRVSAVKPILNGSGRGQRAGSAARARTRDGFRRPWQLPDPRPLSSARLMTSKHPT